MLIGVGERLKRNGKEKIIKKRQKKKTLKNWRERDVSSSPFSSGFSLIIIPVDTNYGCLIIVNLRLPQIITVDSQLQFSTWFLRSSLN